MILSIIASVIVWGTVGITAIRVFNAGGGIRKSDNKIVSFLLADKSRTINEPHIAGKKELLYIFFAALAFRVFVFAASSIPIALFNGTDKISIMDIVHKWKQWDATGYNNMIKGGYKEMYERGEYVTLVFLPLYSFIARIFNFAIQNTQISALLTSSLCYSAACCFMYKLVLLDYSRETAKKALIYISVFPFGFFFGAMLTESTFFLTTAASFYFIRRHNWLMVGVFGIFAALSRISGILILFPAAVEFIEYYGIFKMLKDKQIKQTLGLVFKKGSLILLSLFGVFIYLYCNYKTSGDWFKFLELEKKIWNQENCYFGRCIQIVIRELMSENRSIMVKVSAFLPDLGGIIFMLAMMLYGARRNKNMYTVYIIIYFIINAGITWPMSIARYTLCALPLFIFLADFTERHKKFHTPIMVSFAILFGIYLTGYLFTKQIM
ncbi:MAG: hypothetical protein J1G06_06960 [Oscillospiraceae bacterium]|nr:hypothetical protein [Oscillospiraceae bacterium]